MVYSQFAFRGWVLNYIYYLHVDAYLCIMVVSYYQ